MNLPFSVNRVDIALVIARTLDGVIPAKLEHDDLCGEVEEYFI